MKNPLLDLDISNYVSYLLFPFIFLFVVFNQPAGIKYHETYPHISNVKLMMTNIRFVKKSDRLWLQYKRVFPGQTQLSKKNYYHCTGHEEDRHCSIDVRSDYLQDVVGHVCFSIQEHSMNHFIDQFSKAAEDRTRTEMSKSSFFPSLDPLESFQKSWISFQCKFDLSISAATSESFHDFASDLITLGQTHPQASPKVLFPPLSPFRFKQKQTQFASVVRGNALNLLKDHIISVSFDGTKIGERRFLLSYVSGAVLDSPLFYSLYEDIVSQENYAKCAAELVETLYSEGISVGSFCTDGLTAQVQALSESYHGFSFHSFHLVLHLIIITCFSRKKKEFET
jgi:hypothetical protein